MSGCGNEDAGKLRTKRGAKAASAADAAAGDSTGKSPRLAHSDSDQVLSTLVIPFGRDGVGLTQTSGDGTIRWVVDMEERETVTGGVAPKKYLKVKGDLTVPMDADNREYDVGCLYVELKDNVYYREQTWLRLATTGIAGKTYTEVKLPIAVDFGGWKAVPELEDSITLQQFKSNSLKKYDATLCFRLDFSEAPAQEYEGDLIVQYLRPGVGDAPPACDRQPEHEACKPRGGDGGGSGGGGATDGGDGASDGATDGASDGATDGASDGATDGATDGGDPEPWVFACAKDPVVLKAKQDTDLAWADGAYGALELKLAADPSSYAGALGTITMTGRTTARYVAPDKVPTAVRIIATARPIGSETLPAFCEVRLVPDQDIGVADDGETRGVVGNVFRIPTNTQKLPNLDALTPVALVVVPNLDVPERAFSAGFPGVRDLFEWFAIAFRGRIAIPQAGECRFKLTSDDGANLYIDGRKVVDNDGVHPTTSKEGSVNLSAGLHDFRVDYYQGPRYHITLQLFWKCAGASQWTIVPPSAFERPLQ